LILRIYLNLEKAKLTSKIDLAAPREKNNAADLMNLS